MAMIGFIVSLIVGGALIFYGAAIGLLSKGFAGRTHPVFLVFVAAGLVVLYLAFQNAPFEITLKETAHAQP